LKVFTICSNCGQVYPIYEQKIEPKIQDFTETFDNPFEVDREAVIGIDSVKGNDSCNITMKCRITLTHFLHFYYVFYHLLLYQTRVSF
jgi:hypothetical protein